MIDKAPTDRVLDMMIQLCGAGRDRGNCVVMFVGQIW